MDANNLLAIKEEENFIRDNLYNDSYLQHAMNSEPYHGLIEITEDVWNKICTSILQIKEDTTLYFPDSRLQLRKKITRSWKDITKLAKNNNIEDYFGENADNVFIAGGKALATLLTVPYNDIDYFTTVEIKPHQIESKYHRFKVTPQIINFDNKTQLIKRLYKVPHEIVHSFDIDCCAVLINRHGQIYGSKRFIYALINGYNTVDFNYFSPSYEWRLIKYSNRGFSVYVQDILNCDTAESLYTKTEQGMCVPDRIWSFADIDDILNGSMLRSLLMNAKGLQKLLIASSVTRTDPESEVEGMQTRRARRLHKLSGEQLSDYEEPTETLSSISGKIQIDEEFYFLNGDIGYNENGDPNSYQGLFEKLEEDASKTVREFSSALTQTLLTIFNSPYRKVNPGEQTTSTFHRTVLDDPNEWYKLDKAQLFEESLYTFLYFKQISYPPSLYDIKVSWFGPECINLFVYHFARLVLNNRIYDKFNGIEVTELKVSFGNYIPKSLKYNNKEYFIPNGSVKGIFGALLAIGGQHNIFSPREMDLLNSLYIRASDRDIPKIEKRNAKLQ
ncbi:Hypothetical protein HVR_LOCUS101 [uncultured virus]|nr:Hypothetical protein HVR_LOCUS101 [uncultured virus]